MQRGKVLVVDDDEIFREITASSLTDQGLDVLQAGNGREALEVLRKTEGIGVVLSDIRMPEMDGVALLKQIRALGNLPVVLATGFSELTETKTAHELGANAFLAKPFENEELVNTILQLLDGAEDKAKYTDEDFARIVIDDFVSGKILKHNIFIRLTKNKFVKIAHEGLDLDIERVQAYRLRGVTHLYLLKKDFREYLSSTLSLAKKVSSAKTIDRAKKERFLRQTGNLVMEKVLIEDLDPFAVEAAREFFQVSLETVLDDQHLFSALTSLNESSDHLYAHSLGVSLYSIMLARALGWKSDPTTFRVGLAGLFHDIGLKEIDRKIVDTPRISLERYDRVLYETHVVRGVEILATCESIPEEVAQAILQHHEDPTGFGYPHGKKGVEISPLARLITVADIFCEFAIKNPDYPKGMSAAEAVDKMAQFRASSLDMGLFSELKKLVKNSAS